MVKKITNEHGLTENEENFCVEYLRNNDNGAEAYRIAFKPNPKTKPESIWQSASRLLARPKVKARIDSLKADAAKGRGVTVMALVDEYAEAYQLAKSIAQPSAMVAAVKAKAELLGLQKMTHVHQDADGKPLRPAVIELVAPGFDRATATTDDEDDE